MFLLGNETLPTLVIVYIITFPRISTCTSSCVPTISRGRGRDAHGTHVLSVVLLASTCSSGEGRWLSPSLHLLVSVRRLHNMAGNESFEEYVGSAADAAAFNQRLQARDDGRTKRTVGDVDDGESTGTDKAREYVRTLQGTARMESMAKLREQSRQSYLSKREELELKKLELKIRDEETMFATETLTAEERHRLEQDKELLAIAKRRRILRSDAVGYYVPGGGNDIVEGEAVPVRPAREEGGSSSLQHECAARDRSKERIHASRALREIIARPNTSRNERNMTERGASKVGNVARFPRPGARRRGVREPAQGPREAHERAHGQAEPDAPPLRRGDVDARAGPRVERRGIRRAREALCRIQIFNPTSTCA